MKKKQKTNKVRRTTVSITKEQHLKILELAELYNFKVEDMADKIVKYGISFVIDKCREHYQNKIAKLDDIR